MRIGKIIVVILVVIAAIAGAGILCNSAPEQDTPTSERITSRATDTPAPTRTRRPQPTATRQPLVRASRGIGVSRSDVQSTFESQFIFAPPDVMRDGRTRVLGNSFDGLALIELVGPARNLESAYISVAWPDLPEERIPGAVYLLSFAALAAPRTWDSSNWIPDNIENAMFLGEVSTKHRGLRITLDFFEEWRLLSLKIEPDR